MRAMATNIVNIKSELKCSGVGRDAEDEKELCFYFNRIVSDDEMRYLHEVVCRAVAVKI